MMASLIGYSPVCRTCQRFLCSQTNRRADVRRLREERKRQAFLDGLLRVDHAGEYGAVRIYQGQIAVLGATEVGPTLREMCDQEKVHLETFNKLLPQHRVRPTILLPLWNLAGFALGAGTAMLGSKAAMACTVAVEDVIGNHYNSQLRSLVEDGTEKNKHLLEVITKFRDEELEHLDIGLEHNAEQAPFYNALSTAIKTGCRVAIWVSTRF